MAHDTAGSQQGASRCCSLSLPLHCWTLNFLHALTTFLTTFLCLLSYWLRWALIHLSPIVSTRSGRPGASGPLYHWRHQGSLHGPGSGAADGADGDSSTHRPQTGRNDRVKKKKKAVFTPALSVTRCGCKMCLDCPSRDTILLCWVGLRREALLPHPATFSAAVWTVSSSADNRWCLKHF